MRRLVLAILMLLAVAFAIGATADAPKLVEGAKRQVGVTLSYNGSYRRIP